MKPVMKLIYGTDSGLSEMQEISHTLQTITRWLWHATCGGTQDTDAVILLFSRALEPQLFWRSDHILHLQLYVVFVVLICPISTHFMFLLNVLTTQEQILLGFIINGRDRREGRIGSYSLLGIEFLFGMMKKFWRWIVVMVVPQYECD